MAVPSLKDYLDTIDHDPALLVVDPKQFSGDKAQLETKVVSAYGVSRERLASLVQENIFSAYLEAEDINNDFIKQYEALLGRVLKAPYKITDDGWLRKVAHGMSQWYRETKYDPASKVNNPENGLASTALGLLGGVILGAAVTPLALPVYALLFGSLFWSNPDLKGQQAKFTRSVENYVRDVYRLNIMAQKMEHEVADIRTLDPQAMDVFVQKYGKERLKREGMETNDLEPDELLALVKKYGALELQEHMQTAREHVRQVREVTADILTAAGFKPYQLKGYVASDIAKGEALARTEAETNLDLQIENLREQAGRGEKEKSSETVAEAEPLAGEERTGRRAKRKQGVAQ